MSCVLEILSYEELISRKTNLLKQLEKVNNELLKKHFNNEYIIENNIDIKENNIDIKENNSNNETLSHNIKKIKIKVNIVKKK